MVGWAAWILTPTTRSMAAWVSFRVFSASSSSGRTRLCTTIEQSETVRGEPGSCKWYGCWQRGLKRVLLRRKGSSPHF